MPMLRTALLSLALSLGAVTSALAAPIDLTLRLDPGQPANAAMFSWSLMLRVDPGEPVGSIAVWTSGLTSFTFNPADTNISQLDSVYAIDPVGDGRNFLNVTDTVVNYTLFTSLSPPGVQTLLGTFLGPDRTAPPVAIQDCESECGYTFANPAGYGLPADLYAIHVVPEPGAALLLVNGAVLLFGFMKPARGAAVR
jgi:hypothetical protein